MRAKAREVALAHGGGFAGRKHSVESKEKMRLAKLNRPGPWLGKTRGPHSEATKEKMRAAKQQSGFMPSAQARALAHQARLGTHHSLETIAKMRAALAKPDAKAKMRASVFGKPCRHSKHPAYYNGRRFRSTYETRCAAALDALGIEWAYEPRRFDCGPFTYAPDFYLVKEEVYWEVKGWYGPDSRRKVEAFRRRYPDVPLVVFDKTCLELLEAAVRQQAA